MSIFALYGALTDLLSPIIRSYLKKRSRQGKEDPSRLDERLGIASLQRPEGPLIWAHAASIGESLSLLPLLDALARRLPRTNLLVTSGTVTSARLLAERLPSHVQHQFVPVDIRRGVRRFLDHWKPDLAIFVESELWPNLVIESYRRKIPLILLNGRVSDKSFRGWMRFHHLTRRLFSSISLVLAQDERHAERWRALGVSEVSCTGDLKAASAPLPVDLEALATLNGEIGSRPVWLAASTHEGEETIVFEVHRRLLSRYPDLLTLLAPRHPRRGDIIAEQAMALGLRLNRRSHADSIRQDTSLYLVDTLGEMGLFYRLAPIVLVAGSLGAPGSIGGHNPLEAARLGRAILHGRDMVNCSEATAVLDQNGGAVEVDGPDTLFSSLDHLLSYPDEVAMIGEQARRTAIAGNSVIDATMSALEPRLSRIETGTAQHAAGHR